MKLRDKVIYLNNMGISEYKIAKYSGTSQSVIHYYKVGRNKNIPYDVGIKIDKLYDEIVKK